MSRRLIPFAITAISCLIVSDPALCQSSSLLNRPRPVSLGTPVPQAEALSLIGHDAPITFRKHDLINIEVDEQVVHIANARSNRRRDNSFQFDFDEFIVLLSGLRLRADQAIRQDAPSIDISALNNARNQIQSNRTDSLRYSVQAEVAEVKPNGNLVIEAHGEVSVNNEVTTYRLSGVINPNDVNPFTRTISSELIANKRADIRQVGPTRDSVKRGFLTRFLDVFQIF